MQQIIIINMAFSFTDKVLNDAIQAPLGDACKCTCVVTTVRTIKRKRV